MVPKQFKVIIAGGSVTGLTLAIMLETVGIEYVLLEAHSELAPQLGASIALFPNSLRILDQLGMYEEIRDLLDGIIEATGFRSMEGAHLTTIYGIMEHMMRRHGYPMIFIDRQMLMQVLARNVKRKNQILVGKRVAEVITSADGVTVKTKDGDSFTGDILVGADGIHSVVRKEMWRLARKAELNYFGPNPQSDLKCDYKCLFGISEYDKNVKSFHYYTGQDYSFLLASGPGRRVYWFLFVKLDSTKIGDDIPRYTKEDEAQLVEKHATDRINESMTFAELYSLRTASIMVPIQENVYKRWHFQNIITLGDSVHKIHPLTGQGGNSAIESAAVLVNYLVKKLNQSKNNLSEVDIEDIFVKVYRDRSRRAQFLLNMSAGFQWINSRQSRIVGVLFPIVAPLLSRYTILEAISISFYGAAKLDMIDVPKRPRAIPFYNELPAKRITSVLTPKLIVVGFLAVIAWLAQKTIQVEQGDVLTHPGYGPLRAKYLDLAPLDRNLSAMVSAFSYPLAGNDPAATVQLVYFLPTLVPVFMIWTIDSYRIGLRWFPISLPIIFGIATQLLTIGRIGPIYFILSIVLVSNGISSRPVPLEVARKILPATTLGYLIPTALMLLQLGNSFARQDAITFWKVATVYCAVLTAVLSKPGSQKVHYESLFKSEKKRTGGKVSAVEHAMFPRDQADGDLYPEYSKDDVPYLRSAYIVAFVTCAINHIGTLAYLTIYPDSEVNFFSVFLNLPGILSDWELSDLPLSGPIIYKYDMWFYFSSLLIYLLYTVWDVRKLGYVTNTQAVKAWVGILVGQILLGPGAVYAGVWWWKEDAIAALGH